ncbi:MAG: glycoside hydrolase family 16 protein, partial [Candidatus Amulumruptor sp.]|nr:glycoside hydrolase family 16 protein [Candidatus Amulumruptor sp.]
MKSIITSIALGALLAATASSCHKVADTDSGEWQLVWEENFDSTAIDTATWTRIPRGTADWNNYMTSADTCYEMRDGNLVLHGICAYEGDNDSVPYLTGGVYTRGKKSFGNGRLEIRARLGAAQGAWPAIWLLPDPAYPATKWPDGGEIDIMERLSYDSIAYQTVHSRYTLELKLDT